MFHIAVDLDRPRTMHRSRTMRAVRNVRGRSLTLNLNCLRGFDYQDSAFDRFIRNHSKELGLFDSDLPSRPANFGAYRAIEPAARSESCAATSQTTTATAASSSDDDDGDDGDGDGEPARRALPPALTLPASPPGSRSRIATFHHGRAAQ